MARRVFLQQRIEIQRQNDAQQTTMSQALKRVCIEHYMTHQILSYPRRFFTQQFSGLKEELLRVSNADEFPRKKRRTVYPEG